MRDKKFDKINGQILLLNGKVAKLTVEIFTGGAISRIDDVSAMRKLVKLEQKAGNKNIIYNTEKKMILERFPGKKREEITKIIAGQLNKNPRVNVSK